ncbi:histidine phosphatase family protein [Rummeliibacillus sp. JY-2-4R]
MHTNLYLVRHAHSTYTPDELGRPLSTIGYLDARRISKLLIKEKIDIVISSPYKRAIQTVEGVAKSYRKEVLIVEDFKERKLSDQPVEDFNLAISKLWDNSHFSWNGGESNSIAQKRGVKATLKLLNDYENKNIVVGTHGNIMVLIMNYFNSNYGFSFWKQLDMPDIYKLTFDKTELTEVKRIWNRF